MRFLRLLLPFAAFLPLVGYQMLDEDTRFILGLFVVLIALATTTITLYTPIEVVTHTKETWQELEEGLRA